MIANSNHRLKRLHYDATMIGSIGELAICRKCTSIRCFMLKLMQLSYSSTSCRTNHRDYGSSWERETWQDFQWSGRWCSCHRIKRPLRCSSCSRWWPRGSGSGECCLKLKLAGDGENRSSQRTMPQMKNILPHGNSSFNTLFSYGTQLILEGDKWTARVFAMLASFSFFKECIAVYVYTWTEQKLPLVGRSYLNWMALMTTHSSQITGSKFLPLAWMRSTKRSSPWKRWDFASIPAAAYLRGR